MKKPRKRDVRSILGLVALALAGACSDDGTGGDDKTTSPTCTAHTFSLRSLDGFQKCCEGTASTPLGDSLTSCDPETDESPLPDPAAAGSGGVGAAPMGGAAAMGGALGGSGTTAPSAWVVLTHAFESDWVGGNDVCLHITSTGAAVSGEVSLFTLPDTDTCALPDETKRSSFRATESATAYVCLNSNGPLLESPGANGALAVAFRFNEGSADALRIDAIDVKKDVCDAE